MFGQEDVRLDRVFQRAECNVLVKRDIGVFLPTNLSYAGWRDTQVSRSIDLVRDFREQEMSPIHDDLNESADYE